MNLIIEWKSILLILTILSAVLVTVKLIDKKMNLSGELKRKLFHMSMGLVMLILPHIFTSTLSVGILGVIALVILGVLKNTKLKQSIGSVVYSVERESLGEVFFVLSVFLLYYLSKGDKILYSIPILILTFADSTAALIGKNYAKENLAVFNEDSKSIEGSFSFFVVAFMATLVPVLLYTTVGRAETLIIATIVGFNVALIEMISHTGNDNLLIPLTTFALVSTHIGLSVEELKSRIIILGIIFVLVTAINRIKSWSKLALVEILVAGYLTITLYDWYAVIPPLLLLLTVMRFPKLQSNEKNNKYDARIIETNLIIGVAICGIVAITGWRAEFFMIYACAYAMHMIVNSYVRFKYFIKLKNMNCILLSIFKGIGFVFLPSLAIQYVVFKVIPSWSMFFVMAMAMILSSVAICFAKKNVEDEEISIGNGYLHMLIVFACTLVIGSIQFLVLV